MIPSYTGMKAEKASGYSPLPAGGYVATIVNAKVESYSWGSVVVVAFDILEGDYKNFFKKAFDQDDREDKKWRGTYRLTVPDESSQYFENNKRSFNNFIYALEDSNSGYHYDCDEKKLKGKKIGVLFRNKEWEMNGKTGWTTECGACTCVRDIREGNFKPLKDKPLKASNSTTQSTGASVNAIVDAPADSGDDLPF